LLLARGEEGVHVDEEVAEGHDVYSRVYIIYIFSQLRICGDFGGGK
jgi:hypothetical protein